MRYVIVLTLLLSPVASQAGTDMVKLDREIDKAVAQMKKESFEKRFRYIAPILSLVEKEKSKINDSNFAKEEENHFKLNVMKTAISELQTPFTNSECEYHRGKLLRGFSDYKTNEVHNKLKNLISTPLKVFDGLCGESKK